MICFLLFFYFVYELFSSRMPSSVWSEKKVTGAGKILELSCKKYGRTQTVWFAPALSKKLS
jgi:hypothetical protein